MDYKTILFEKRDSIGLLTLNRPETVNAMNQTMIEEVESILESLQKDEAVRILILTGSGEKGFCSGMDMKESAAAFLEASPELLYQAQKRASHLFHQMRSIPQPVIAAVHGAAAGAGFSFAMASDIRIITPQAKFSAAYINIGLGGADLASSYFLPKLIGSGRANEFLLTGNYMTADEAMQLGFASRKVDKEKLLDTAYEIATTMAGKNPMGLIMTKEAINQNLGVTSLEQALHLENRNQAFLATAMKVAHLIHQPKG